MWQHNFIQANRIRLHYVSQGSGELVILLHGFPEFWYSWRYQIPVLARHFKVVVPDLRGYNDSDKPAQGYDIETLTEDIRSLIENLGYARAHVVGHDWGGTIAWNLAQRFPKMLGRLAILNAPPPQYWGTPVISRFNQQLRVVMSLSALQMPGLPDWLVRRNLRGLMERLLRGSASRKGIFTEELVALYESALQKPGVLGAVWEYSRQMLSPLTWLRDRALPFTPITVPTLILWGHDDTVESSHPLAQNFRELIVGAFELKLVPSCGHWIQQEAPQTVNRELIRFLRSENHY